MSAAEVRRQLRRARSEKSDTNHAVVDLGGAHSPPAGAAGLRLRGLAPPFRGSQPLAVRSRQAVIEALIARGELTEGCEGGAAVADPTCAALYVLVDAIDASLRGGGSGPRRPAARTAL